VKWRLWHGRVDRVIRDLAGLLARLKPSQQEGGFSLARLHSLGPQLLTYVRTVVRSSTMDSATEPGVASPPLSPSQR
jgi:hypothetical protein